MGRKLTNADVDLRLVGRDIRRVGEFTGTNNVMEFECLLDGFRWATVPSSIFRGHGCPSCGGSAPLNTEIIHHRLNGRTIKLKGKYINANTKTEFECLVDGYRWEATPINVLRGLGCPKCSRNMPLNNEIVDTRLLSRGIRRIDDYVNGITKIRFECAVDGHIWNTTPSSVLQGRGCPVCAKTGFDPLKPSVVYVYTINDSYCGYGITNNFKNRDSQHRSSFKKYNVHAELIATFECSGEEAQEIEKFLKNTFKVVDAGIGSFHTEATDISNLHEVLRFISVTIDKYSKLL